MSSAVGIRLLCCSTGVISCSGICNSPRSGLSTDYADCLIDPRNLWMKVLEVQSQCKLDLTVCSQSNRALDRLSQQPERSTSLRLRETTARLEVGRSEERRV